jgi:hypothetical protein
VPDEPSSSERIAELEEKVARLESAMKTFAGVINKL